MTTTARPFDDESRTGFELELLAPRGQTREDLARALAHAFAAVVEVGLKLHATPVNGRPAHDLSPTFRVMKEGRALFTVVDDVTIQRDLDRARPTRAPFFRAVIDDPRLTLVAERVARAPRVDAELLLAPYLALFDGVLQEKGAGRAHDEAHRVAIDPAGQTLVVVARYDGERERVAEVITAPLTRAEREDVLRRALAALVDAGATIPLEAALHLHLDAAPWRTTPRLRQLILDVDAARALLYDEWRPNPACTRLGAFDPRMVERARAADDDEPFAALAHALTTLGATKYVDVNVLGLIHPRPRQPTVEVRCLPMTLDAEAILARVDDVERFFTHVARTADDGGTP